MYRPVDDHGLEKILFTYVSTYKIEPCYHREIFISKKFTEFLPVFIVVYLTHPTPQDTRSIRPYLVFFDHLFY